MTTNASGKLNMGGVSAIKGILQIPVAERTERQAEYLDACLTALAHQPVRWQSYQDWGKEGPIGYLARYGIEFKPVKNPLPRQQSWYDGCGCGIKHWRDKSNGQEA